MKKMKPNLRKLFNFHTIILVIFVIVVSTLHTHSSEGKLQRLHKHHHNHNYKPQNFVDIVATNNDDVHDDGDVKQQQAHGRHNQHHSHHHQRQRQRQNYDATTPSLEFTTSSSAVIPSDNEFFIKQQQQQQEQPLIHKDDIYYKTKDLQPSSSSSSSSDSGYSTTLSTTSKSSLSIHLMKQNVHKRKASSLNSTSTHAETLSKSSIREHTHHSHNSNKKIISTPLIKPEGNSGGIDNNPTDDNFETIYSEGLKNRNSNWNLATKDADTKVNNRRQSEQHRNQKNHNEEKPEFNSEEEQRPQQNYDDYYSDAENDDVDDDGDSDNDNDNDDDYNEDEGDNDGMSYDDDKNFSDRSYARITRSKLDDDYIDDEPYRNGINELSMQRDAAPGVLTEQKYLDVGNEKAVQQARERYIQEQKRPRTPHELATEHWHRMIQATKCRKPLPRVIPVSNNTSKRYEPYATILHRCGDDTGCCGSTASVCTVKRHEIVMVYVFSYDFNYRKEIEALPMQNHTECHCVNRGSLLHDSVPRDKRSGGSSSYMHHFQRLQRRQQQQQQQHQQHRQFESQPYSQLPSHHQQQWQNMLDCHCPRHFNVFEEDVERRVHLPKSHSVFIRKCRCDCLVNHQTCLRFKHGEEGFSLEDRKCILERNCKPPVCLYGEYNLRVGRCPSYRSHLSQTT